MSVIFHFIRVKKCKIFAKLLWNFWQIVLQTNDAFQKNQILSVTFISIRDLKATRCTDKSSFSFTMKLRYTSKRCWEENLIKWRDSSHFNIWGVGDTFMTWRRRRTAQCAKTVVFYSKLFFHRYRTGAGNNRSLVIKK